MARALWKATIRFGPVNVPVKLYTAVRDVRLHSHPLHDEDRQRLQQRMVCPVDNAFVHREHIVNGYEVEPERYVMVTDDEYEALEPQEGQDLVAALEESLARARKRQEPGPIPPGR